MDQREFISKIAPDAISHSKQSNVPASLIIAQAALESNWGNSGLTKQANNLFGIKGKGPAGSVSMLTTEYRSGKAVKEYAPFRKYSNWSQSIADYVDLLHNKRYAAVLNKDGKEAALAVAAAGYATDPKYGSKLIGLMDKYDLYQYDKQGGDDPMTENEKQAFDELLQQVNKQADRIAELEKRDEMPIPGWAKEAVTAAVNYDKKHPLIDTPNKGSLDFYRLITVMHRRGLFDKKADDDKIK